MECNNIFIENYESEDDFGIRKERLLLLLNNIDEYAIELGLSE